MPNKLVSLRVMYDCSNNLIDKNCLNLYKTLYNETIAAAKKAVFTDYITKRLLTSNELLKATQ